MNKFTDVKKACQEAVEEAWNKSENKSEFFFPAGFCFIRVKGLKNKNALEKAGFNLKKSYKVGFYIDVDDLFEMPDYVKNSDGETRAVWKQSLLLKEIAGKVACKMLEENGVDCWMDSIVD
jgi:hypothetical protein